MKKDWHPLYCTAAWISLRKVQLAKEPLCRYCKQLGVLRAANTVDHVIPHKGNRELFYDSSNLQSLCKVCHDSTKAKQERNGYMQGSTVDGLPLDGNHHWHKG